MPTSTGATFSKMPLAVRQAGFTLLEILVVVMLVGLLTAVIATQGYWTSNDSYLDQESARLQDTIALLNERSLFSGQLMALRLKGTGWEPLVYDRVEARFLPVDDTSLAPRSLPPSLEMEWQLDTLEDDQVSLKQVARSLVEEERMMDTSTLADEDEEREEDRGAEQSAEQGDDEDDFPQVFFFPSGEVTPVTLSVRVIEDLDQEQRLQVTALGRLLDPDAPPRDEEDRPRYRDREEDEE